MKRTFNFGKVDYNHTGRKNCAVSVTVELRETEKGLEFSASGDIWNTRHTDIYCGGQCLDEIARYIKTPLFEEIYKYWKAYHLNGMHPECIHQAAQGWKDQAKKPVTIYHFKMNLETIHAQNEIKNRVFNAAKCGEMIQTSPEDQKVLSLNYSVKYHMDTLPAEIAPYYKPYKTESKSCGWIYETEHPEGILCKPCPVCGYKYGSSWNYFPIPENDLNRIKELIETGV